MGKISEAQAILRAIGMPERQQTPICALSLLALAHIRLMMTGVRLAMSGFVFTI